MNSRNRIQPVNIETKSSRPVRRLSTPETITESFEWVVKGGRPGASQNVILSLFIQTAAAAFFVFVPFLVLKHIDETITWESLVLTSDCSLKALDIRDAIRVSIILGIGWFVFVAILAIMNFIPKVIKLARKPDNSIPRSAQKLLEMVTFLTPYFSVCCGGLASALYCEYFYSGQINIVKVLSTTASSEEKVDKTTVEHGLSILTSLIDIMIQDKSELGKKLFCFKFILPVIVNTFALFMVVLTSEKALLQYIAVEYRTATTANRFTDNAFAISILKALYRSKIDKTLMSSGIKLGRVYDPDLTALLYDVLVPEGDNNNMTITAFKDIMSQEQAIKLFSMLDIAQNGDLTKDEFVHSIEAIYNEREILGKLVGDHDGIIAKLDEIMLKIVYAIDFALCLSFLGIPGLSLLRALFGMFIGFGLIFSDAFKKFFDAMIFVLVTHPYDLGDRVDIEGKFYYVESVGLWTSTFIGPGGLKTIMTNASLADKKIGNFRRSPSENEVFEYIVRPECVTEESIAALREDCVQFFIEHRREYLPNWHLEINDKIDPERFKIIMKVFHRDNFQMEEAKNERSQKFVMFFKDALIRNGFVFSPAMPRALVANF